MANFNFNKVILGGRVTKDIELRTTTQGVPVTSFTVAVNRPYNSANSEAQQKADFFNCTAWRATAEFVSKYFHRGSSICVVGSLQNREWTDQQNVTHRSIDVVVESVNFVDAKSESAQKPAAASSNMPPEFNAGEASAPAYSSDADTAPKFEEMSAEYDLPF